MSALAGITRNSTLLNARKFLTAPTRKGRCKREGNGHPNQPRNI